MLFLVSFCFQSKNRKIRREEEKGKDEKNFPENFVKFGKKLTAGEGEKKEEKFKTKQKDILFLCDFSGGENFFRTFL